MMYSAIMVLLFHVVFGTTMFLKFHINDLVTN